MQRAGTSEHPNSSSPEAELRNLYLAEYGEFTDIAMRGIGIVAGGALLYLYTGWAASYLWGLIFTAVHAIQFPYLRIKQKRATETEAMLGGVLFVFVHIAFIWLPTYLAAQEEPELMLVGLFVIVATAMYHLRRSDTARWLVIAQIMVFGLSLIYVAAAQIVRFEGVVAWVGIIMVTTMAVVYVAMTMMGAHRKHMELIDAGNRLIQEQKMSAIGQLAGGVAHDFNNVLTIIKGNLELYDFLDQPGERRAALDDAYAAAERAEGVVQQLLVYARKSPNFRARTDVTAVTHNMITLGRSMVPARIQYESRVSETALWVDLDERQLTTALLNLLKNAVDAIDGNGTIRLSLQKIVTSRALTLSHSAELPPGSYAVFKLTDTGHGIPPDLMSSVLDPFFTTKAPGKGTGLGLSMVLGFAETMGGGLEMKSSPAGTAVALYFPLADPPIEQPTTQE